MDVNIEGKEIEMSIPELKKYMKDHPEYILKIVLCENENERSKDKASIP